jgi:hypothetical protein
MISATTDKSIVSGTIRLNYRKIIFRVIESIDATIDKFPNWLRNSNIAFSSAENVLNAKLADYLNVSISDEFEIDTFRFLFTNQPAQGKQSYTPDIGVSLSNRIGSSEYFFYVEGKRFPARDKIHEREYVCGKLGGIQRFKENKHGTNLSHSAMVAYIQKEDCSYWQRSVNSWVDDLIKHDKNFWKESDKLIPVMNKSNRYHSEHKRINNCPPMLLHHFWIKLI